MTLKLPDAKRIILAKPRIKYEILILILFVVSRLPDLGYDTFNTDVWKWKARIFDFGTGIFTLDFAKTIQKYHPGVTLMWLGTAGVKVYNLYYQAIFHARPPDNDVSAIFGLHFTQKLAVVIAIALTIALIFYALKSLFGIRYAVITVLLVSFEPLYVALTRELHLEGLMTTFMLASFVWLLFYSRSERKFYKLFLSAVFAALAFLTKTSSLFLLPFTALTLILDPFLKYYKSYNDYKIYLGNLITAAKTYLVWLLLTVVFFFLGWPGMWVAPFAALKTVYTGISDVGIEGGHIQLYFGKLVTDPGITFYFVVLWLKSSLYLIAGLLGFAFLLLTNKNAFSKDKKDTVLYSLFFFLFYFAEISIPSKKLDRYLLPSIIVLLLPAGFFYEYVYVWLTGWKRLLISAVFLIFLGSTMVWLHPDYFSYYNPISGGLEKGIWILEPKWLIGQKAIEKYFAGLVKSGAVLPFDDYASFDDVEKLRGRLIVAFPEKYYTQVYPFIRAAKGLPAVINVTAQAKYASHMVYPVWDDTSEQEKRFVLRYEDAIYLHGVKIFNVYFRVPVELGTVGTH